MTDVLWEKIGGDARLRECASEGCGQHVSWRMESVDVASEYCDPCKEKIEALKPKPNMLYLFAKCCIIADEMEKAREAE